MRRSVQHSIMFLACVAVAIAGCKKDKKNTPDAGTDAGEDAGQESVVPSGFERFCVGLNWLDTLSPARNTHFTQLPSGLPSPAMPDRQRSV